MSLASSVGFNDCGKRWRIRIDRAQELQSTYPAAEVPLNFYGKVLGFQRRLADSSQVILRSEVPLREQMDVTVLSRNFPALLALAAEHGPQPLSLRARSLQQEDAAGWQAILQSALVIGPSDLSVLDTFFARVCLQPIAETLQSQLPPVANNSRNLCPACGGLPQLAVLRPEGEGASRWLLCSFCLREWLFRRIVCPWCGEEDKEKLPRYSAEDCAHVLVEACDTCKKYLKAVNLTVDGHAEPLIDEAALAVLDIWAADHGYTKIVRNLIGF